MEPLLDVIICRRGGILLEALPSQVRGSGTNPLSNRPAGGSKRSRGFDGRIEANRNFPVVYFNLAAALAQVGRLDEARAAAKAGLALNLGFSNSRARTLWTAVSDDPTYLARLEPILDGLRKAGVPDQ